MIIIWPTWLARCISTIPITTAGKQSLLCDLRGIFNVLQITALVECEKHTLLVGSAAIMAPI